MTRATLVAPPDQLVLSATPSRIPTDGCAQYGNVLLVSRPGNNPV
jgi:hypothetical protein